MTSHAEQESFQRVIDKEPDELLARFSGEFIDPNLERTFLNDSWADSKKGAQIVLFVGGFIFLGFIGVDLLATREKDQMLTVALRGLGGILLLGSFIYLKRARSYFVGFHLLVFVNEAILAFVIMLIGFFGPLTFIHNLFHVFILTLVFYLFFQSRFLYPVLLNAFVQLAYFAASLSIYQLPIVDIIRFVLYVSGANFVGILLLKNLNLSRRRAFIRLIKEQHLNQELQQTLDHLRTAQQEVKTLQGLIPICSHCKRIRDDKGYWNQIEAYIQDHSGAKFSHGICPQCAKEHYPGFKIYGDGV